ncbi:hypothetical protein ARMGADRAFT_1070642 [Armillaria gallica]|uniref:Uncharacterized protein n=1 Tax=Armillaria gallica TaxID=47427 RepID=A0A2H3E9R0_ARMGA|nr:hypothetical protein ARMGADRAFT_1070642 [Armillaria gallica]
MKDWYLTRDGESKSGALMRDNLFVTLNYYGSSQPICMSQHLFERLRSDSTTTIPDTSDDYLLRQIHERNNIIKAEHKVHVS